MSEVVRVFGKDGSVLTIPKGASVSGSFKLWLEMPPDESSNNSSWMELTAIVNHLNNVVESGS